MDRSSKSSMARDRAESAEREISSILRRLESNEETFTDEVLERRALMLLFIKDMIDTTVPVEYRTVSDTEWVLSWRTQPIKIKDGIGGLLDWNFGQFDCAVKYTSCINHGNRIKVVCNPVDLTLIERRRDYFHPHLSYDGSACLGNIQGGLIQDMGFKDIAKVIETITEFLQHYNRENPYVHLEHFIQNRWDNAVCESGLHIMAECDCLRCNECGGIFEEEDLGGCGHCHSCCMVHHATLDASDTSGINGTSCFNRYEIVNSPQNQEEENPNG